MTVVTVVCGVWCVVRVYGGSGGIGLTVCLGQGEPGLPACLSLCRDTAVSGHAARGR